jgi:hypothetical protein
MQFNSDKIEQLKLRAAAAQFVLALNPSTLLPIDLAAPAFNKTAKTVSADVTRNPECLPQITRKNGRVFFKVEHILAFNNASDDKADYTPEPIRKPGRPTKAEQIERAARVASRLAAEQQAA